MILDLGHFRFVNDKEQESSSNSNIVDDMEDDDGMTNNNYACILELKQIVSLLSDRNTLWIVTLYISECTAS